MTDTETMAQKIAKIGSVEHFVALDGSEHKDIRDAEKRNFVHLAMCIFGDGSPNERYFVVSKEIAEKARDFKELLDAFLEER